MPDGSDDTNAAALNTLGERLRAVRTELFGPDGVDELARLVGVAPQVWRNIEQIGALMTAGQLRAFVEVTGASPLWLLRGEGARYRAGQQPPRERVE